MPLNLWPPIFLPRPRFSFALSGVWGFPQEVLALKEVQGQGGDLQVRIQSQVRLQQGLEEQCLSGGRDKKAGEGGPDEGICGACLQQGVLQVLNNEGR